MHARESTEFESSTFCAPYCSDKKWKELIKEPIKEPCLTSSSLESFLCSILVWINKPHVVNRRLCGAKLIHVNYHSIPPTNETVFNAFQDLGIDCYSKECISVDSGNNIHVSCSQHELHNFQECDALKETFPSHVTMNDSVNKLARDERCGRNDKSFESLSLDKSHIRHAKGYLLVLRDLHPREIALHPVLRELVLIDFCGMCVTFTPICKITRDSTKDEEMMAPCPWELSYHFRLCNDVSMGTSISLSVAKFAHLTTGNTHVSEEWLANTLLSKLVSWCREPDLKTDITSLRLVDLDAYNTKYNYLKQKYGVPLVKVWPESTDPSKFVFEDVAISAYLLLLWETKCGRSEGRKQSFVDLGCGNGLLVHILTSEGHHGLGLDIRKRKIWDLFRPTADLQEHTITPSAKDLFPQYDWIIGNHSDELTPWIPVIAARSSYKTKFFVLPCCAYDFDSKFVARSSGASQYETYLEFVSEIGRVCGYTMERDTLRIPSTKRVCLLGRFRTYPEEDELMIDTRREDYINSRCHGLSSSPSTLPHEPWSTAFTPRPKNERVRNCQRLDKSLKERVVRTVFDAVLGADNSRLYERGDGKTWRKGGVLRLADVVALFESDCLRAMKSECGGIQTLLRNHHSVFQVSGGKVALRDLTLDDPWGYRSKVKKGKRTTVMKTSLCWFYDHHPDGCPLQNELCNFAHGLAELKPRPQ